MGLLPNLEPQWILHSLMDIMGYHARAGQNISVCLWNNMQSTSYRFTAQPSLFTPSTCTSTSISGCLRYLNTIPHSKITSVYYLFTSGIRMSQLYINTKHKPCVPRHLDSDVVLYSGSPSESVSVSEWELALASVPTLCPWYFQQYFTNGFKWQNMVTMEGISDR